MDRIHITGLKIAAVIGTYPQERLHTQELIFDLHLSGDFSQAGKTDTLEKTVNYRAVEEKIIAMVEHSSYLLLEALAEKTAEECLTFPEVSEITVCITKPDAALRGETIALEITRKQIG